MKNYVLSFVCFFSLLFLYQCNDKKEIVQGGREITDVSGRKVLLPKKIERVVAVNAGAMRFISYMGAIPLVVGVEDSEHRAKRPYNFAFPEIKNKEIIGPQPGGDAELIVKANPDIIFWAGYPTSKGSAEQLQEKTGIPTITIKSGDFGIKNEEVYNSLRVVGKVLNKEKRAEELVAYIKENIKELQDRTLDIQENEKPSVYVGGLSFNGSRGLGSTRVNFAPFSLVNAKNVAQDLGYDKNHSSPITIDLEKLIEWNPDYIFIDSDGWLLAKKEIEKESSLFASLKAFKNNHVYIIPRYINNSISYDYALIDAWYVGKVLYPEKFKDIEIEKKSVEILEKFYDKKISLKDFDLEFKQIR